MSDIWADVDAAISEAPINILPLIDDTDFKSIEASVVYNATGLALKWNFVTPAGAFTQTAVTPTDTGGNYDWVNQGNGYYTIEIPASGGASINNDTEGFGWFSGVATGVLPWRGPVIGFRASGINDKLIESAYDANRALAGLALPGAAAEASGGLPTLSAAQASNGTIQSNVHRWLTGTPNALQSGRVDSYVGAILNGVIVAASFAATALDAVWSTATRVLTAATNLTTALATPTNITAGTITTTTSVTNPVTVSAGSVQAIWDALTSALTTSGSIGKLLVDLYALVNDDVVTVLAAVDAEVLAIKAKTDNLPESIKKNTAFNNFEFEMVLSSDHVTGATGLTVTAERSIDGGAYGACANAVSEVGTGTYKINLAAADVNGNYITFSFTAATADATKIGVKTAL